MHNEFLDVLPTSLFCFDFIDVLMFLSFCIFLILMCHDSWVASLEPSSLKSV